MARFESDRKAGFYPTPPSQVQLIAKRLRVINGSSVHLYDPCAGTGEALFDFAQALKEQGGNVVTYGVELEKERAQVAEQKLDHVLQSPYEDTHVTPHSMSYLWLNPPYSEHGAERAEVVFLRDLTDAASGKLQPGGLLGFCIPRKVLYPAATLLALRFEDIRIYRFTDPEFTAFRQVVVFGYRRAERNPDHTYDRDRLRYYAQAGNLPTLDAEDSVKLNIPPAARPVQTFLSNRLDAEEVGKALTASPLWEVVKKHAPRPRSLLKPPAMPLKPAHIAVSIAAGAVGGKMGSHILVGTTERVMSAREEIKEDGGSARIETYESKSVVRLFDKDGIHVLS